MNHRNPPPSIPELETRLHGFCQRHGLRRLEVFGSIANGGADAESDVDLLVTLREQPPVGVAELLEMAGEVEEIVGAPVDFVLRSELERAGNVRSEQILRSAVCIYGG